MSNPPAAGAPRRALLWPLALAGVALASILFYTVPFGVRGLRMPVGNDSLFYVVVLQRVPHLGIADAQVAARPAYPLLGAVLRALTGGNSWAMSEIAPIAFAACTGLAAAAIATRWWLRGAGIAAFGFLAATSGVIARLVAGKTENIESVWLMAAVLAVAAWSGRGEDLPSWTGRDHPQPGDRSVSSSPLERGLPIAVLMCVITLVEWPLGLTFTAVLAASWVLSWLVGRRLRTTGGGVEESEQLLRLMLLASLAGAAVGLLFAFGWDRPGPGAGIHNLPPVSRYPSRLREELSLAGIWVTVPLVIFGLLVAAWRERRPPALTVVLSVWLAGAAFVTLAGLAHAPVPTYRAIMIGLPVALAASAAFLLPLVGVARPERRTIVPATARSPGFTAGEVTVGPPPTRSGSGAVPGPLAWIAALALGLLSLVPAANIWWRSLPGIPTSVEQLSEMNAIARYMQSLPDGTPVVIVYGGTNGLPTAEAQVYTEIARSVLPPDQDDRVLVFVGTPQDALAGRPTQNLRPSANATLRELFRDVAPALRAGSPILSGRALDPVGFASAASRGAPLIGGGSVAILRGQPPGPGQGAAVPVDPLPSWPVLALSTLLVVLVLGAAGAGWSRLTLPGAPSEVQWLLAPAFGAGALTLIAFLLVHLGVRPAGAGGWATLVLSMVVGAVAWVAAGPGRALSDQR
jgi:hypothetical protein